MLILARDKDPNQHPQVFLKIHFLKQMVQGSVISYLEEVLVIPNFPKQYLLAYFEKFNKQMSAKVLVSPNVIFPV